MPKIAHISDIHFGSTFDVAVWQNVRARIIDFRPDLLVVSGDLVDHPWPFRMLAVKAELLDLCKTCPSQPQLFVVPGNHDVRLWGNVRVRIWPRWLENIMVPEWFNRIMFGDTVDAQAKIEAALGISLGLNEECKKLGWRRWLKRLNPKNAIRGYVKGKTCDKRLQSCDWHRNGSAWPSESLHSNIAITCFDSNPAKGRGRAFASGEVGQSQITRLDLGAKPEKKHICPVCKTERAGNPNGVDPVLLRIAVLHHHPLPIALSAEAFRGARKGGKLEPYLLLRNSGDLLQQLQKHKFDLVLHGHKHRPQFARLELNTDGVDPYPLTVLAGGSTAKDDEDRANNTLRLIDTEANGRMRVRTVERGEPFRDGDSYHEELSKLKQRAFSRARELTKRTAGLVRWENKIDLAGNVNITTEVNGLRLLRGADPIEGLPFLITVPAHGQKYDNLVELDPEYRDAMKLQWMAADGNPYDLANVPKDQRGYCWIKLNARLEPGARRTVSYRIHHAVSNSIAMSSWELGERARKDPRWDRDYEFVGRYVSHPADRLQLRLIFPPGLGDIRPRFRCRRAPRYPEFPLSFRPDIAMEVVKAAAKHGPFDQFVVDEDLQKEEQHKLRFDPHQMAWELDIDYPVPGYVYELLWPVPKGDVADDAVSGVTIAQQKILRDFRDRLSDFRDRLRSYDEGTAEGAAKPELKSVDESCLTLFQEFAKTLMRDLAGRDPSEKQAVFLMTYDRDDLELRPVCACLSWPAEVPKSFSVPLGGGIAGAAFLHNKTIAWGHRADSKSLIRPEPLPDLNLQYVLAAPIFHVGDSGFVTKSGATIGVVTVASDSSGSRIRKCRGDGPEAVELRAAIQLGAQGVAMEILQRLSRGSAPRRDDADPSAPRTPDC